MAVRYVVVVLGYSHPYEDKWWENNIKSSNMRNIESQEDFDKQLLLASDKLTIVVFFSPSCGACKALHPKVCQLAGMQPGLQFLMAQKAASVASAAPFQLFIRSKMR
ncbi:hypothetical protein GUJ93_ZPchr0013g35505 [Zizania palustris]|uniref:Thioredoxin domain-containing protein n=1 Tax=Zizania palustris TaxID=103762 RepID=A0A8J6BY86_ZIZPA|nr:hypothetical protein GUJ93_ZPchr0013g35505 [Zizania palustris]